MSTSSGPDGTTRTDEEEVFSFARANLSRAAARGVTWTLGSMLVTISLQLGYTLVINRLLDPVDFGLVAAAQIALRFAGYFANLGVGVAIVQRIRLTRGEVRTAQTVSMVTSLFFTIVVLALSPLSDLLIQGVNLSVVVSALAVNFSIIGVGTVSLGLLRRQHRFRELSLLEVGSFTIGYPGVGLVLAGLGAGVWSLVFASLVQLALMSLGANLLVRPPWRPRLRASEVRTLTTFGGLLSLTSLIEFLGMSVDTLAVGRTRGAEALGTYNRASMVAGLLLERLTVALNKVALSSFSALQHSTERLRAAYIEALTFLVVVLTPTTVLIASNPEALAAVLLGSGWPGVADIVPYASGAVLFALLSSVAAVALEARGRIGARLAVQTGQLVLHAGLQVLVFIVGWDLAAVASAWCVSEACRFAAYSLVIGRELRIGAWTWFRVVFGLGSAMALSVGLAALARYPFDEPLVRACVHGLCSVVILGVVLASLRRRPLVAALWRRSTVWRS